jgi:hypothetical protein
MGDHQTILSKEISTMEDISNNVTEAMASKANKEGFMSSLEGIHASYRTMLEKKGARVDGNKAARDAVDGAHKGMVERQRYYSRAVQDFQKACQAGEGLAEKRAARDPDELEEEEEEDFDDEAYEPEIGDDEEAGEGEGDEDEDEDEEVEEEEEEGEEEEEEEEEGEFEEEEEGEFEEEEEEEDA